MIQHSVRKCWSPGKNSFARRDESRALGGVGGREWRMHGKNIWEYKFPGKENPEHTWKDCPIKHGRIFLCRKMKGKERNVNLHIFGGKLREFPSNGFYLVTQERDKPLLP